MIIKDNPDINWLKATKRELHPSLNLNTEVTKQLKIRCIRRMRLRKQKSSKG